MQREHVAKPTKCQKIKSNPSAFIQSLWDMSFRASEAFSLTNPDMVSCILKAIKTLFASTPLYLYSFHLESHSSSAWQAPSSDSALSLILGSSLFTQAVPHISPFISLVTSMGAGRD